MPSASVAAAAPAAGAGASTRKSTVTLESRRFYARLSKEADVKNVQAYRHRRILHGVEVCTQVEYSRLDAATQATFTSFYDLGFSEKEAQRYRRTLRKGTERIMEMRASQVPVGPLWDTSNTKCAGSSLKGGRDKAPRFSAYWTAQSALVVLLDDLRDLHEELAEDLCDL